MIDYKIIALVKVLKLVYFAGSDCTLEMPGKIRMKNKC